MVRVRLAKAAEGRRTPRRFALAGVVGIRASVLECAQPSRLRGAPKRHYGRDGGWRFDPHTNSRPIPGQRPLRISFFENAAGGRGGARPDFLAFFGLIGLDWVGFSGVVCQNKK